MKDNNKHQTVPQETPLRSGGDDIIDVSFLLRALWRGKWFIALLVIVGVALGVRDLSRYSPQFEAKMIVVPFSSQQGTGGSAAVSRLARSLGVEVSTSNARNVSTFDRLELLLASLRFAELLQEKYDMLHVAFAGAWDQDSQTWKRPGGRRFEYEQRIRAWLNLRTWSEPNLESLAAYLSSAVEADGSGKKAVKTITFRHRDAAFAGWFLRVVYSEADNMLRELDRAENVARKEYIQAQLASSNLMDIRNVLLALLEQEERTSMLLSRSAPYAARIIEPIFVSTRPTIPNPILTMVPRIASAAGIALLLVLLYALIRRER